MLGGELCVVLYNIVYVSVFVTWILSERQWQVA